MVVNGKTVIVTYRTHFGLLNHFDFLMFGEKLQENQKPFLFRFTVSRRVPSPLAVHS